MSALANISSTTDIKQNQPENKASLAGSNNDLSVTTRIEYNLRFTKQAVLVVADNSNQYAQLASQFLVSLSTEKSDTEQHSQQDHHINVAFLSASTKLNDIQIRCRLIEQLFVNTLFDPEESLAVSALRFAKQHNEPISIVVEHAHALSLQVKYELSQLVYFSKKSKLTINVVLFGLTEAAQQLTENKSLFKSKIVLIDAESGQVLSFDDKKVAINTATYSLSLWQKLSLLGAMLLIAGVLSWIYLLIVDDVNKQAIAEKSELSKSNTYSLSSERVTKALDNESDKQMQKKEKMTELQASVNTGAIDKHAQATAEDVLQAILTDSRGVKSFEHVPAEADDVLQALALVAADIQRAPQVSSQEKLSAGRLTGMVSQQLTTKEMNVEYYQTQALAHIQGYVVQIAGFSDEALWLRFLEQNTAENLYSYQRYLADKDFTVVTSKVYANKAEAKAAILLLPVQLIDRKPWLKPISAVISEINTFTR